MSKALQKKFILTAMAAITILLLVALGAVNVTNFILVSGQSERMLEMLAENEGRFIPQEQRRERRAPEIFMPPINADDAMSARYFLVRLDREDEPAYTDVSHIASVTEEEARAYAADILDSGEERGSCGRFRYRAVDTAEGGRVLIFLDTSSQLRGIVTVLVISAFIGVICWLLMLLLVVLLSKRTIRPIALNMEKQRQFVTNAGHEIKTPLAIILTNTDALELHQGESRWSRNIRTQALRLTGLMQNLLALAKMDEQGTGLPTEMLNLSSLLEGLLPQFQEPAAGRNVTLRADIQPELMLKANRESMTQLFSILLDNGVKYTSPGEELSVSMKRADRKIQLQIRNICDALPEAAPERLFERFYRGDSARTQKNGGYGIGLSAARAIAEAHRGTISAEYAEGRMISFTVRL